MAQARAHKKGFTLIETILYIALTVLLIGGIIVSIYPIFTGTEHASKRVTIDTETAFLMRKLAWGLSSATTVNMPDPGTNGDTLEVVTASGETLSFTGKDGTVTLSKNGAAAQPLLSSRIAVSDLSFANDVGTECEPHSIAIEFDINGVHVGPLCHYVRL